MKQLTDLPDTALAPILSRFCSGKTISTLMMVNARFCTIGRDVLVERYVQLSAALQAYEEIRDVLDITREDIRLMSEHDEEIVTKLSHWCAILDYFETQLQLHNESKKPRRQPQWVVWCGSITNPNGEIQAVLVTPFWTAGAMSYWKSIERENASFCRPNPQNFDFSQPDHQELVRDGNYRDPYGTLFALGSDSKRRFAFQCSDLAIDHFREITDHWRHALIPLNQLYDVEPSIVLVDHSFVSRAYTSHQVGPLLVGDGRSSLCCCWNQRDGDDDWEVAFSRLGELCVGLMEAFGAASFYDGLMASDIFEANEFSNF